MTINELVKSGQSFYVVGSASGRKDRVRVDGVEVGAGLPSGAKRPEQQPRRPGQPKKRVPQENLLARRPQEPRSPSRQYPAIPLWQRLLIALWFLALTAPWLYHVCRGILAAHR